MSEPPNPLQHWFSKCGQQTTRGLRGLSRGPRYYFCVPVISRKETNCVFSIIILQNLFIWNNGITNILDEKFRTGVYASYVIVTKPFLSLTHLIE